MQVSFHYYHWVLGQQCPFLHLYLIEDIQFLNLSLPFHDFSFIESHFPLQLTHSAPLEVFSGPFFGEQHLILSFEVVYFWVMLED